MKYYISNGGLMQAILTYWLTQRVQKNERIYSFEKALYAYFRTNWYNSA